MYVFFFRYEGNLICRLTLTHLSTLYIKKIAYRLKNMEFSPIIQAL